MIKSPSHIRENKTENIWIWSGKTENQNKIEAGPKRTPVLKVPEVCSLVESVN